MAKPARHTDVRFSAMAVRERGDVVDIRRPKLQEAMQAVVAIHTRQGFKGTGFLYRPVNQKQPLIITNAHVVRNRPWLMQGKGTLDIHLPGTDQVIQARMFQAHTGKGRLAAPAFSPEMDIAVLEPIQSLPQTTPVSKFRNPRVPFHNGNAVYILGRGRGMAEADTLRPGKILERHFAWFQNVPFFIFGKDAMLLQTDSVTYPGDSGGPAVNAKGQVVGILSKGSKDSSYVVTAKDLYNTLAGWGIAPGI